MLSKRYAQTDRARCVSCAACTKVCPRAAIRIHHGCFAVIDALTCVGCGKCTKICPADCITLHEREVQA